MHTVAKKIFLSRTLIAVIIGLLLLVSLWNWPYSLINKANAWYHLKTNDYAASEQGSAYARALLSGQDYSPDKSGMFPFLPIYEKVISSSEQSIPYTTSEQEDPNFLDHEIYEYPLGKAGTFIADETALFVNGRQTIVYSVARQTKEEPVHENSFRGTKDPILVEKELLETWKEVATALSKKDINSAIPKLGFAEEQLMTKTLKLSDLSYRLDATPTIALEIEANNEGFIKVGTLTLKQKNCSVAADIAVIYLKKEKEYRFDNVYAALASMCAKPKATGGLLSCANCWLAPVSKQFALRSNYFPTLVATGLNGGGFVTKDTKAALSKLFADAKKNGISTIRVSSAFRSYQTQEDLFNTYVKNEQKNGLSLSQATTKANTYSAKPGHSEHQLGTTVDLMACASPCNFYDSINTPLYTYIKRNAHKFGFIISYPDGSEPYTGYVYEPWHIRYVGNTFANELYNKGYLTKKGFYLYQFLLEKERY